jgi:hypothetical protein
MKKFKHVKYKNTGIIFELLSKQVVSDVLTNRGNTSLNIIKKYFREGTQLHKELACYQALTESSGKKEPVAFKLLEVILKQRKILNETQLLKEKYKLIGEIKNNYDISKFFEPRVSDYKLYASVYKLFEYNSSENPVGHISCYETILEHLTNRKQTQARAIKSLYESQSPDVKSLSFKLIIEKFNSKYQFLNAKQKTLVSKFINENTSLDPFKNYVYSEINSIKKSLVELSKKVDDKVLKIKLTEVARLTNEITTSPRIKDEHISSMIKYYELISHLEKRYK